MISKKEKYNEWTKYWNSVFERVSNYSDILRIIDIHCETSTELKNICSFLATAIYIKKLKLFCIEY